MWYNNFAIFLLGFISANPYFLGTEKQNYTGPKHMVLNRINLSFNLLL